ncbi:hypothetical protein O7634_22345 [Micromonospora sp. WMMD1120]|uniref:hypothetical protein n=1 Tax=Micromonospora sp. WMMD1120 TaxID=3016106 RepID=UPI002415DAD9|nr:hypothetical protein [Micromonospora sp. WMMD1120]MDG4809497.1 hypothetical protein [Micromonospora sp. WMMD1120]
MARSRPPFRMKAMLSLERGTATAADTVRRHAPLADEIGADGIDVDDDRADLLLSGYRVAGSEESAMHSLAERLLHRFGWREQDFTYARNVRYAETGVPPPGPPATRLVIDRADQDLGIEGTTHGAGRTPDRTLHIGPAQADVVARLFVTLPASTIVGTVEALGPWLTRIEPAAVSVDPGRAALLFLARADLATEAERLGLGPVKIGRIEADADHVIDTATAADGTSLWLRRGTDPVSRYWPGIIEIREMVIRDVDPDGLGGSATAS